MHAETADYIQIVDNTAVNGTHQRLKKIIYAMLGDLDFLLDEPYNNYAFIPNHVWRY